MDSVPGTITTENLFNTNMITLNVTADDPKLAYDILQSIIKNYPTVTEYILGDVTMNLVDGSGKPTAPSNGVSYTQQIIRGFIIGLVLAALLLYLYAITRKTIKKEKDLKSKEHALKNKEEKLLSSVEKKESPVLYQIYVGGILPFPDLKSQNIPVKADHPPHVFYK